MSRRHLGSCPDPSVTWMMAVDLSILCCKVLNPCDLEACQSKKCKKGELLDPVGRVPVSCSGTSSPLPSPAHHQPPSFLPLRHPLWASRTTLLVVPCMLHGQDRGSCKPSLPWWHLPSLFPGPPGLALLVDGREGVSLSLGCLFRR